MNYRVVLPLVLMVLLLSACQVVRGSGDVQTETRSVSGFDRVSLSGQGELILTQGEQESLEIEAEDNILAVIETTVRGDTLHIDIRDRTVIRPTEPIRFYLTMPEIAGFELSGSGALTADVIDADRLDLQVSGSGEISIDSLSAASLTVDISGSGDAEIAGQVTNQTIGISGSGLYRAADLQSETVDVEVNGSGEATVWVDQALTIEVNGSGTANYYGTATVTQNINGSGTVNDLGER